MFLRRGKSHAPTRIRTPNRPSHSLEATSIHCPDYLKETWDFCVPCVKEQYLPVGKKVKCTLVQALRLCTGRTARTGSRVIALLFLDHGTRRG